MEFFLCNKRKITINQQYIKIQLPQKHYWENFKITDHNYEF